MTMAGVGAAIATSELWRLGATELAQLTRSRELSSREVAEAHLRRIEQVNPALNAVTIVLGDEALAAAAAADARAATGEALPRFHGVPFTIKANIDVVGSPTTEGLKVLADVFPAADAPTVERMRRAGAIPLGRTNCSTITVRWHTESELWGATVNPWDRSRTPGASSGGEAAAVASGMSPLGLGNDGLGSLRWPAQCCGVAALKPTIGRIPHATSLEPSDAPLGLQLTSVQGPMARRVEDLRAAFEILAGPDWRDPWTVPAPLRGPSANRPIRVALVLDPAGHGISPQVQDGVRKAGSVFADAGYVVEEMEPPLIDDAARALLDMLYTPDMWELSDRMWPILPQATRQFLSAFTDVIGEPDPLRSAEAFVARQHVLRAWGEFLETRPLVVGPICTDPPFEVGSDLGDGRVAETIRGMRLALAVNALGLPAVAVPVGIGDGLPQVVQVIGPRFREDLCLDAAAVLEERAGTLTPIDPR
jgi:amidase